MKKFLVASILAAGLISGCAVTQSTSIGGEYTPPAGKKVTATSSHLNVFMLSPTTADEVDGLMADLAKQCGGKKVTGISTHYAPQSFVVLPIISEEITAIGYCAE
ncbi:MAG: hypothetical protein IPN71_01950 [Fibrobacteres bacterium]|jgi:hypothetical protein|nr:hypothetical protein [Fibrobacterota bacterium]